MVAQVRGNGHLERARLLVGLELPLEPEGLESLLILELPLEQKEEEYVELPLEQMEVMEQ